MLSSEIAAKKLSGSRRSPYDDDVHNVPGRSERNPPAGTRTADEVGEKGDIQIKKTAVKRKITEDALQQSLTASPPVPLSSAEKQKVDAPATVELSDTATSTVPAPNKECRPSSTAASHLMKKPARTSTGVNAVAATFNGGAIGTPDTRNKPSILPLCHTHSPASVPRKSIPPSTSTVMSTLEVLSNPSSETQNHVDSAAMPKRLSQSNTGIFHTQKTQDQMKKLRALGGENIPIPIPNDELAANNSTRSTLGVFKSKEQADKIAAVDVTNEDRAESACLSATDPRMILPKMTMPSALMKPKQRLDSEEISEDSSQLKDDRKDFQLDVPSNLRNKKMKPTECLLFAATLLEHDGGDTQSSTKKVSSLEIRSPVPILGLASSSVSKPLSTAASKPLIQAGASGETANFVTPQDCDVLCGRGGLINKHPGNIAYRKVVDFNKRFYQSVQKKHRILVSQSIVQSIKNVGGKFLISGGDGDANGAVEPTWVEIGFKRAVQKTSQALRERGSTQDEDKPNTREEEEDGCDDHDHEGKNSPSDNSRRHHASSR